ncbi:MAG: hypothetical protein H6667_06290 [Ardenticatenaceae bacterium]|nr:hypothetical protein [Ardenticatenaceae bacterium]MCB9442790.1 hypothetical protein [Ardenticatenaceae bacterium]
MQSTFDLLIMELKSVYDMPVWTDDIFRQILQQVEFEEIDDIDPADLREMTVMALQDLKPEKAAEAVLAVLAGGLSTGARQNLAYDMKAQRMWEEFANPEFHASIFATAVLLNEAFPKVYPRPEIARLIWQVTAGSPAGGRQLAQPTPVLAARLAAAGMGEHSTLRRLFATQLAEGSFPEAAAIIWQVQARSLSDETAEWVVYSSWYWLRPLQSVRTYKAEIKAGEQK